MARLPIPGGDENAWGHLLNQYLSVEINNDGTFKDVARPSEVNAKYTKPGPGIPATDLTAAVQTQLAAAGTTTVAKDGSAVGTRARVNIQDGANVSVGVVDNPGDNQIDITIAVKDVVNALDYGAVFDGVTNDAPALQSAIDAAITLGKPLVLPPGTAMIGASLSVGQPITIVGSGRQTSTLKSQDGLNGYVIEFTGGDPGAGIVGAHFADFAIDGNMAGQTAGGGILANGAVQCSFERMHFYGCYNWGLVLGPITGGAFGHHNRVFSCLFDDASLSAGYGGGVWITSNDENWFVQSDFEFLGGSSNPVGFNPVMLLDQAGLQTILGCCFVSGYNNAHGVRVQDTKGTKIVASTFDGVGGDGVFIAGVKCIVANNLITGVGDSGDTPSSGIHLEFNTHYNTVVGNSLETATVAGKTRSLIREEGAGGAGDNIITNNTMSVNEPATVALLETGGVPTIVRNNIGWQSENSGTATIASGDTSIVVAHEISVEPEAGDISVTPMNSLGTATKFWVSAISATTFTISVDADPGVATAMFSWNVRL